ncbi:MAG: DNA primase [Dehalococcoidales bacterium]|nr:DNA primase [Dehalococcoidales bacterium]
MPDYQSNSVINEIKDRLNIVDIVSPTVDLKKMGRNFKGICPFHAEKTPSFIVFPDGGNYHCFGCGANGDILTFVMKTQGLDFGEALQLLAQRAGVKLPERRQEAAVEDQKRDRLREINSAAAQYFNHLLLRTEAGKAAREYLERRGIAGSTVETFQLGYSMDSWSASSQYLSGKGYKPAEIVEAGLVVTKDDGDHYDRFRGRLMFPIRDNRGNVIGFGARALDDSQPKYLNSPQTAIFDKGASLYGIDQAQRSIRDTDRAVIVEGYVDVLISHQCGIKNVIASLGTALTERQVGILKKLTKNLVLALDPDAAGDEATLRGLEVAKQVFDKKAVPVPTWRGLIRYEYKLDADIRIITLPRGQDPDEVIRENAEQWQWLVDRALPIIDYYFNVVTSRLDLSEAKGKSAAVEQLLPVIKELRDKVEQAHYLQKLANLVQVSERSLEMRLSRVNLDGPGQVQRRDRKEGEEERKGATRGAGDARTRASISLEEYFLTVLFNYPEMFGSIVELNVDEVEDSRMRLVVTALQAQHAGGERLDWDRFCSGLDPILQDYLQGIRERANAQPPMDDTQVEQEVNNCLRELRRQRLHERIQQLVHLTLEAKKAEDWEGVKQFIERTEVLRTQLAPYEREGAKARVWK